MANQTCPVCGCTIGAGESYEKGGIVYCCEPCATGEGQCGCGSCTIVDEEEFLEKQEHTEREDK